MVLGDVKCDPTVHFSLRRTCQCSNGAKSRQVDSAETAYNCFIDGGALELILTELRHTLPVSVSQ